MMLVVIVHYWLSSFDLLRCMIPWLKVRLATPCYHKQCFVCFCKLYVNGNHKLFGSFNSNSRDIVYGAVIVAVNCQVLREFPPQFIWGEQHKCQVSANSQICLQYLAHCRHLLLLSPKADIRFTIPLRLEGWVYLAGWLCTKVLDLTTDSHPSKY